MEGGVDPRAIATFTQYADALVEAGGIVIRRTTGCSRRSA